MLKAPRYLIVNADDFGLSPGVNQGIAEGFDTGVVTSASLMVRAPAAAHAAALAASRPALSVGLHIDLGEWARRRGEWVPVYEVVPLANAGAVRDEIGRQLERFRSLIGRDPTHLDSHQHVHLFEPVREIVAALGDRSGVPVRALSAEVRYCGDFYGQTGAGEPWARGISVATLLEILDTLPAGTTELGCHPGRDGALSSDYAPERARELETLTDARVRARLTAPDIELTSHHRSEASLAVAGAPVVTPEAMHTRDGGR